MSYLNTRGIFPLYEQHLLCHRTKGLPPRPRSLVYYYTPYRDPLWQHGLFILTLLDERNISCYTTFPPPSWESCFQSFMRVTFHVAHYLLTSFLGELLSKFHDGNISCYTTFYPPSWKSFFQSFIRVTFHVIQPSTLLLWGASFKVS